MSDENKNTNASTTLHLGKFAPGVVAPAQPEPETGLTVTIKTAAAETMRRGGAPVMAPNAALPAREMLGAVSYCYAKGVYASEDIERRMMHDAQLREAVHGEVPDALAIRRFRRLNRSAIQQTLEKAFSFLGRKKKAATIQHPLVGQPADLAPAASDGESTIRGVRREAEECVQQAAFIDNMSKD